MRFDPKDGTVDRSSVVFYVDGGTEGFRGQVLKICVAPIASAAFAPDCACMTATGMQARLIVPHYTACFHCMIDSLPRAAALPYAVIPLDFCARWLDALLCVNGRLSTIVLASRTPEQCVQ